LFSKRRFSDRAACSAATCRSGRQPEVNPEGSTRGARPGWLRDADAPDADQVRVVPMLLLRSMRPNQAPEGCWNVPALSVETARGVCHVNGPLKIGASLLGIDAA